MNVDPIPEELLPNGPDVTLPPVSIEVPPSAAPPGKQVIPVEMIPWSEIVRVYRRDPVKPRGGIKRFPLDWEAYWIDQDSPEERNLPDRVTQYVAWINEKIADKDSKLSRINWPITAGCVIEVCKYDRFYEVGENCMVDETQPDFVLNLKGDGFYYPEDNIAIDLDRAPTPPLSPPPQRFMDLCHNPPRTKRKTEDKDEEPREPAPITDETITFKDEVDVRLPSGQVSKIEVDLDQVQLLAANVYIHHFLGSAESGILRRPSSAFYASILHQAICEEFKKLGEVPSGLFEGAYHVRFGFVGSWYTLTPMTASFVPCSEVF